MKQNSQAKKENEIEIESMEQISQVRQLIKDEKLKNIQLENKIVSQEREYINQINQLQSQVILHNKKIKEMQSIIDQFNQSQFVIQLQDKSNKIQQLRHSEIQLESQKSINANLENQIQNLRLENVKLVDQNEDLSQQVQQLESQLEEIKDLAWEAMQEKVAEIYELQNMIQQLQAQTNFAQTPRESISLGQNSSRNENEDTKKLIEKLNRQNSSKILKIQTELEVDFKSQIQELKNQFLDEITNLEKKIQLLESEKIKLQQQNQQALEQKEIFMNETLKMTNEIAQQQIETLEKKCEKLEIEKLKLDQRLEQQQSFKSNLKEKFKQSEEEIEQRTVVLTTKIEQQHIEIERLKKQLEQSEKKQSEIILKQSQDLEKQNQEFMQIIQKLKQEKYNLENKFQELISCRFSVRPTMFQEDFCLANELANQQSIINRNSKAVANSNLMQVQRESVLKNPQQGRTSYVQLVEAINNRNQRKSNPFEAQSPDTHKDHRELQLKVLELTQTVKNLQDTIEIIKQNYSTDLTKYLQEIDDLRKELAKRQNLQISLQQSVIEKAQLAESIKQSKQN